MASKNFEIEDFRRILVVEGYSDLLFYAELLEDIGLHKDIFISELGGKRVLSRKLEDLVTPTLLAKTHIGFIFDANGNAHATCASFENILSRLTGQAVRNGGWTAGNPKIGLFIVPGDNQEGEIETLVWNSWANDPSNAQQKKCVLDYVNCMFNSGKSAHSPNKGFNVFDLSRPELAPLKNFLSGFIV